VEGSKRLSRRGEPSWPGNRVWLALGIDAVVGHRLWSPRDELDYLDDELAGPVAEAVHVARPHSHQVRRWRFGSGADQHVPVEGPFAGLDGAGSKLDSEALLASTAPATTVRTSPREALIASNLSRTHPRQGQRPCSRSRRQRRSGSANPSARPSRPCVQSRRRRARRFRAHA